MSDFATISSSHLLLEVRQQAIRAGDQLATIRVMLWLTGVYVTTGQLHLAHQETLSALALIEQISGRTTMAGYLYGTLFEVYYAWNRQEEASDALHWVLRIGHGWQQVDLLGIGEEFLAQLSLARGDLAAAQQALQKLETLCEQEGLNNLVPLMNILRVQWWLTQGKLQEASDWAAQTTFHPDAWDFIRKEEFLMLIRVYFAQQQYTLAVEMLERWSQSLDQPGNSSLTIKFLTLYVVALHYAGKREQALLVAARLLSMTEPEGFIRVYLDAGEQMKQVLKMLLEEDHALAVSISRSYVSRLLAAFEQEEQKRVLRAGTHLVSEQEVMSYLMAASREQRQGWEQEQRELTQSTLSTMQSGRFEPLSRQEQRVLRLLVAGRTYGEMAEALIVSLNTIKTQVSSIYRKLGVSRRAEAIVQARRLHLL